MTHTPGTCETKEHTQMCLSEIAVMQMKGFVGPNPLWVCGCPPRSETDLAGLQQWCQPSRRCTFQWSAANGMCNLTLSGENGNICREHGDQGMEISDRERRLSIAALGNQRWVHLTPAPQGMCAPSDTVYEGPPVNLPYEFDPITAQASPLIAQPAPVANDFPAVWPLVMKDMIDRDQLGRKRYGVPLQPFNGRDALRDAYEEALDLVVYLRQALEERQAKVAGLPS